MKKAVVYARYSSERQTEQSIEGQLTVCRKYALDNEYIIIGEYIDRAMSGTNDNRAAFQKMLRDSAQKEWQYVIVYKGDRFSRNRIESAIHKKTLRDNGVKVVSATENIPDTPEGIILESLLEGMAEYYSAELSQKVKRGIQESRRKKQLTDGHLLYGYDLVEKKPVENHDEAIVVNDIHQQYVNGRTAKDIVQDLNAKGLRDKRGKPFDPQDVYRMLRQKRYTVDEIYPPIVPQELKEQVLMIIELNKRAPARRKSYSNYLLSGKMLCGECGGMMTGESGTSKTGEIYHYYKCYEKKRHSKQCTMPSYKKDAMENMVFSACCEVLQSGVIPYVIETAYGIHSAERAADQTVKVLEAEKSEKEKALTNIMRAIEQGIFTATTQQRIVELEEAIMKLKHQIAVAELKAGTHPQKEEYEAFLYRFMEAQTNNESFKQEVIELLVRQVIVFQDRVCITFNYFPINTTKYSKEYRIDSGELMETQKKHQKQEFSSKIKFLEPPRNNNPNFSVFAISKYWGVWIINNARR